MESNSQRRRLSAKQLILILSISVPVLCACIFHEFCRLNFHLLLNKWYGRQVTTFTEKRSPIGRFIWWVQGKPTQMDYMLLATKHYQTLIKLHYLEEHEFFLKNRFIPDAERRIFHTNIYNHFSNVPYSSYAILNSGTSVRFTFRPKDKTKFEKFVSEYDTPSPDHAQVK
jgi:hypothetical protein